MIRPPLYSGGASADTGDAAMRFAITATDRYLGVFHALLERGWSVLKVFTTPVDGRLHHHTALIELARKLAVPVQISSRAKGDDVCVTVAG